MIKKLFILLLAVLPLTAMAQFGTGKWVTHSRFAIASAQNVVDTKNYVYYLATNCLYRFDKATKTQVSLDQSNGLSDALITGIYFNSDKDLVVVTYDDSNIDIIKEDGTITNVPNIKDAVMKQSRTINDVTFATGKIYVATNFGYVVISDDNFQMIESRVGTAAVTSIAEVGDWLLAYRGSVLFYAKKSDNPETFASFKQAAATAGKIFPINATSFFMSESNALYRYTMTDNGDGTLTFDKTLIVGYATKSIQRTPSGFIANFFVAKEYYLFDANGVQNNGGKTSDSELFSCYPGGDGTLWSVNANGLHNSAASSTYYTPNSVSINGYPYWMGYDKRFHKLYLSSTSDNGILGTANTTATYEIDCYDGTNWTNVNPTGTTGTQGWYWPVFDPNDTENSYFISSRLSGIFKVVDGAVTNTISASNAPFVARKAAIRFDNKGNLWAAQSSHSTSMPNTTPVKVLPAAKLRENAFAKADWTTFNIPDMLCSNTFKFSSLAITTRDTKAYCCGYYGDPIIIWTNDDDVTTGNYKSKSFFSLPTTDAKTLAWDNGFDVEADLTGNICFGTSSGFAFFNPDEAWNEDFAVYVPTDLDGTKITDIAVDTLNRKWVGTNGDGIYLLSADCKTVIKHFNSENSKLLCNVIYQLCCNTDDNSMFIVMPTGIQQYFSDYTPSAENYDNVIAYPNPVRRDYTGLITITGLMENSTVVIKDNKGNEVKRLTSTGGMCTWNGCDASGNQLPTGTYDVYAAQGTAEMPAKPYTKVMILKQDIR